MLKYLFRIPKGTVSVQRRKHDCDDNIKVDLNLI